MGSKHNTVTTHLMFAEPALGNRARFHQEKKSQTEDKQQQKTTATYLK